MKIGWKIRSTASTSPSPPHSAPLISSQSEIDSASRTRLDAHKVQQAGCAHRDSVETGQQAGCIGFEPRGRASPRVAVQASPQD